MSPSSFMFWASFAALSLGSSAALAAPPTKDECVDAHGQGQDARDAGQLTRAGKLFLACADAACPELVVRDCARYAEDVQRRTPTVTFAARDREQHDLPDTAVLVDGVEIASALGDGKAHAIDPGRHEVRFVHGADETSLTIVVNEGEKGRAVVGVIATPVAPPSLAPPRAEIVDKPADKRPAGPLALTALGAAAMIAGGTLLGVGFAKVPEGCSLHTHTCATRAGDPALAAASRAVTFMKAGGVVGGSGAAVLVGSLVWYFAQSPRRAKEGARVAPWIGQGLAGISIAGAL
jgi:hypothetical protein